MKTLWILEHYASEPKHGGISRQYDFAVELSRRGHRVVVICSSYSHYHHNYIHTDECKVVTVKDNVYFVYLKTVPYKHNGIKRFLNMISYVSQVKKYYSTILSYCGHPNTVTGSSVHPFTWLAASWIAKKNKARFCVEVRDLWPFVWVQNKQKSSLHPTVLFFGALERWAYKRADKIIYTFSNGEKYFCDKLGISKKKVFWIGQPMDCNRYDKNAELNIKMIPDNIIRFISDSFVCVFSGYYVDYEGIYTMLEVAKELKKERIPIKMLFLGSGYEKRGMEEYVKTNNLNNVLISQRINKEVVPAVLKKCKICLVQLAHKGKQQYIYGISKNKIYEYMYSGACTVFGFDSKDDPITISKSGFVVKSRNSTEMFNRIVQIYQMSYDEWKKYGENGREYVLLNHHVSVLTDKLEAILFDK